MIEVTREILRSVAGAAPRWSRMGLIALGAALIALPLLPGAPSDAAPTGSSGTAFPRVRGQTPWLVVACNFDDQRVAPANRSELEKFYSKAGAGHGYLVDYWDEVSFHQLDISGTKVTEWSVASHPEDLSKPLSRGEWQELSRLDKIRSCVNGPHGVNTDAYFGVVAVFPETKGTTATAISGTSRTVRLSNAADFPTGARPFMMAIGREWVRVTGTSDGAYTVDRGQVPPGEKEASTAAAHPAGTPVGLPGDLGAPSRDPGEFGCAVSVDF